MVKGETEASKTRIKVTLGIVFKTGYFIEDHTEDIVTEAIRAGLRYMRRLMPTACLSAGYINDDPKLRTVLETSIRGQMTVYEERLVREIAKEIISDAEKNRRDSHKAYAKACMED